MQRCVIGHTIFISTRLFLRSIARRISHIKKSLPTNTDDIKSIPFRGKHFFVASNFDSGRKKASENKVTREGVMLAVWRTTSRSIGTSSVAVILLCLLMLCAWHVSDARAQARASPLVEKINSNTIMMLTAGSGLTYGAMASDLATVLNDGDDFRILPVQGHSAFQNVRDVRYLHGIDVGFTQSNVLGHYRRKNLIPDLEG